MIGDDIAAIIQTYDGKQEIPSNQGFQDPQMEAELRSVGWAVGEPWCAFLGIVDWTKAYASHPDTLH